MMALRKRDFQQPAAYADGRKVMAIEDALAWAYQQELALLGAEGTSPIPSNWSVERVDGGSWGGRWDEAILAQYIAPDALEIHKAVKRLETDHWLDRVFAVDEWKGLLVTSCVPIIVDSWFFKAALPRAATLVMTHAKLGNQPALPDAPEPKPIRNVNGTPVIRRETTLRMRTIDERDVGFAVDEPVDPPNRARGRNGIYPQGSKCELEYYPTFHSVAADRADYMVWALALKWLPDQLGHLERHEIMPSATPVRPWAIDSDLMT